MEEDEVQFCPLVQGSGTGSDSVLVQKQALGRSVINALDELKKLMEANDGQLPI